VLDDDRFFEVRRLIFNHVRSPSLRHIRDPNTLDTLARQIVRECASRQKLWDKWSEERDRLIRMAAPSWVPLDELREYLNGLPGAALTRTDVAQRLRAVQDEEHSWPDERLQAGCVDLFKREKSDGTAMPAIVWALQEHIEQEEQRLRIEQEERYREWREQDRLAREQRLLSGADCGWTQLRDTADWHCRMKNGRTYRLAPTKDKRWTLHRVAALDDQSGPVLGTYRGRGDATKAVSQMAYQPEPRW